MKYREHWATRFGLILAMAGNAVGLGNFLRFPVQAVSNGGGAFMIPYLLALLLLGLPLMWVEWGLGRYGGIRGHGTAPGMFEAIWKNRLAKYLGLLGVALPLIVVIYYVYIECWTLSYVWYSATGELLAQRAETLPSFFTNLIGGGGYWPIYGFFLVTVVLNYLVMRKGISGGIEKLAKIAMPALFIFAVILVIRVFTLGAPKNPDWHVLDGMAFLWNPNFDSLSKSSVWLAAAGQVFFTLSIGFGVVSCYASYLREHDDVVLSGLSTASLNEFAEVVLGGSLTIPLAFAFFGGTAVGAIAQEGPFTLAFVTIPTVFKAIPAGQLFSTLWYMLLFFAGITSSVALGQAAIAFLEDEYDWIREKAVAAIWAFIFVCSNLVIFGPGVLDELDFWAGNFGIVLFGLIEVVLFMWVFGSGRAWDALTQGADIKLPRFVYYIMKYVTPLYLLILLFSWAYQSGWSRVMMYDVAESEIGWRWAARGVMLVIVVGLVYLIRRSRHLKEDEEQQPMEVKSG